MPSVNLIWSCQAEREHKRGKKVVQICTHINKASRIGQRAEKKLAMKLFCRKCRKHTEHKTKVPKHS